jgi:hypothetical protein
MTGTIAIVLALRPKREPIEAIGGPYGPEPVFSPGQDLVDIHLMTDIPDKLVLGCLEDPMQGDGEFNDPEIGAKVPATLGQPLNQLLPYVDGQFGQLLRGQLLDVRRMIHHFEISAHVVGTTD